MDYQMKSNLYFPQNVCKFNVLLETLGCSKSNSAMKTDLKDTGKINVILFILNKTLLLPPTK